MTRFGAAQLCRIPTADLVKNTEAFVGFAMNPARLTRLSTAGSAIRLFFVALAFRYATIGVSIGKVISELAAAKTMVAGSRTRGRFTLPFVGPFGCAGAPFFLWHIVLLEGCRPARNMPADPFSQRELMSVGFGFVRDRP
jgi:hypothetical protein